MKLLTTLFFIGVAFFSFAEEEKREPKKTDVQVILEKTFLSSQAEPLLNMIAIQAISESEKKIDREALLAQFRKEFVEEKAQARFAEPYLSFFTAEELTELRKIHENPVWEKYARQAGEVFQNNLSALKETFKELALNAPPIAEGEEMVAQAEILQVTQDNFAELISRSKLPLVVDVNAKWCHPCQMMEPIIEELSQEYEDRVQFAKIDYDSQNALAEKYGVTSLPTLLFFRPGKEKPVMKNVGFISKKDLKKKIAQLVK